MGVIRLDYSIFNGHESRMSFCFFFYFLESRDHVYDGAFCRETLLVHVS